MDRVMLALLCLVALIPFNGVLSVSVSPRLQSVCDLIGNASAAASLDDHVVTTAHYMNRPHSYLDNCFNGFWEEFWELRNVAFDVATNSLLIFAPTDAAFEAIKEEPWSKGGSSGRSHKMVVSMGWKWHHRRGSAATARASADSIVGAAYVSPANWAPNFGHFILEALLPQAIALAELGRWDLCAIKKDRSLGATSKNPLGSHLLPDFVRSVEAAKGQKYHPLRVYNMEWRSVGWGFTIPVQSDLTNAMVSPAEAVRVPISLAAKCCTRFPAQRPSEKTIFFDRLVLHVPKCMRYAATGPPQWGPRLAFRNPEGNAMDPSTCSALFDAAYSTIRHNTVVNHFKGLDPWLAEKTKPTRESILIVDRRPLRSKYRDRCFYPSGETLVEGAKVRGFPKLKVIYWEDLGKVNYRLRDVIKETTAKIVVTVPGAGQGNLVVMPAGSMLAMVGPPSAYAEIWNWGRMPAHWELRGVRVVKAMTGYPFLRQRRGVPFKIPISFARLGKVPKSNDYPEPTGSELAVALDRFVDLLETLVSIYDREPPLVNSTEILGPFRPNEGEAAKVDTLAIQLAAVRTSSGAEWTQKPPYWERVDRFPDPLWSDVDAFDL